MVGRIIKLGGILIMAILTGAAAKEGPTFYTPERVAHGRENVARYEWAKQCFSRILGGDGGDYYIGREYASARDVAAQSDDFVWTLQPTTRIPRVYPHESRALCPIHGTEVRKENSWVAWRVDPIRHPYKVQCRLGGEWYPSNDYLAGDLTSGEFPDDGNGCDYQGTRYYFLRDYAHLVYGNWTIPALCALSQAWLLTGDKTYARKGCILLARLATEYPNFTDRKDRLFYATTGGRDPHYTWKTGGMITDLIWETFCLEATALAYDGLYSYMDQDPELLAFLKGKGMPVETAADLRRYIEENLIRVGMQGLLNGHIHGNEGFHQAAALACALVMDDYGDTRPNSHDMVDYAFHGIGHCAYALVNGLTRDGGGHESPGYNLIKLDFIRVNRLMEAVRRRHPDRFPPDRYPDLFANPKARALFDHFIDITLMNLWVPAVGDSGTLREPYRATPDRYSYLTHEYLYAFSRYGDPRHARAATRLDGTPFTGELFEHYPAAELQAALAKPESVIRREPRVLDGYGVGILESGEDPHRRAVVLNYSSLISHRQQDNLNLEVYARGLYALPDLGYPFTWDYVAEWDGNLMAHNTVSVDETQPAPGIGGAGSLLASAEGIHVIVARHDPYPVGFASGTGAKDVDHYERTVVLVDVDPERFYVVDLFAVAGGTQHDQSWHGPLRPMQAPPLDWVEQGSGTLAGPEVAQFAEYADRWGRRWKQFPSFLTGIRRARLAGPAVWSWDYGLPEGDGLRLHLVPVGGPMAVIQGAGRSPAHPPSWSMEYLIARRPAHGRAPSYFLSVLDVFQKTPVVQRVRLLSEWPLVLEVTRPDGVDEVHLATPPGPSRTTAHRPLGVRVRSRQGERWIRDVQVGEYARGKGPGYATGTICDLDYATNRVAVSAAAGAQAAFAPGRTLRIYNAERTGLFRIVAAKREGSLLWLTLDKTALLAQGPVTKVAEGSLWLGVPLTFANSSVDEQGRLKPGRGGDAFAGSRLGEGKAARMVRGVAGGETSHVFLTEPVPQATLEREFAGKVINLWQYGPGDRVEAARVRVSKPQVR